MTRERFQDLAEAYGGDLARWPADVREAAAVLLAAEPAFAQGVLAEAGVLDQALDGWAPLAATHELREAIVAAAPLARPSRVAAWIARAGWGAGLAAACAAGLILGVQLTAGQAAAAGADEVAEAMTSFDLGADASAGDV
jgi:hypothetical protein